MIQLSTAAAMHCKQKSTLCIPLRSYNFSTTHGKRERAKRAVKSVHSLRKTELSVFYSLPRALALSVTVSLSLSVLTVLPASWRKASQCQ